RCPREAGRPGHHPRRTAAHHLTGGVSIRARVGLLHYTSPPIIGGVETILHEQAVRLAARGYPVTILSGRGGPLPEPHAARLAISWLTPIYRPCLHEGEPWDLLRRQHPRITSIFVSAQRLEEWNQLMGAALDASHVIPNGIDAGTLLKLGPRATELNDRFGLL